METDGRFIQTRGTPFMRMIRDLAFSKSKRYFNHSLYYNIKYYLIIEFFSYGKSFSFAFLDNLQLYSSVIGAVGVGGSKVVARMKTEVRCIENMYGAQGSSHVGFAALSLGSGSRRFESTTFLRYVGNHSTTQRRNPRDLSPQYITVRTSNLACLPLFSPVLIYSTPLLHWCLMQLQVYFC
jgi:hypothetical protein